MQFGIYNFMPLSLYVQHVFCSVCNISAAQAFLLYFFCFLLLNNFCFYSLYIVKELYLAFVFPPCIMSVFFGLAITNTSHVIYSITSVTTPAPTVLPPSLTANLSSFSIAIGAISSTCIVILSPGIIISTPSGSVATPVTSVVLK